MKNLIIIFFIIISYSNFYSQAPLVEWSFKNGKYANYTEGKCIANDSFGNIYILGNFYGKIDFNPGLEVFELEEHNFNGDMFIQKVSSDKEFIWALNIGPSVKPSTIIVDKDNNLIITGYFSGKVDFNPGYGINEFTSIGYEDVFILKLNENGIFQWARSFGTIGSDLGGKLDIYNDNSILLTYDLNTNNLISAQADYKNDIIVKKLNSSGIEIWSKNFVGTGRNVVSEIKKSVNNNIYLIGSFNKELDLNSGIDNFIISSNNNSDYEDDIFVLKLDSVGNFKWGNRIGGDYYDFGNDMVIDTLENIYLTGSFQGNVDFNPNIGVNYLQSLNYQSKIFILKLDSLGTFQWASESGGSGNNSGTNIEIDKDGFLYNSGVFEGESDFDPGVKETILSTPFQTSQTFVSKLDVNGNLNWAYQTSGDRNCSSSDIVVDKFKNVYLTGWFNGKFDPDPKNPINDTLSADASNAYAIKINQKKMASLPNLKNDEILSSLYPNPTSNLFNVNFNKDIEHIKISLNDIKGNEIQSYNFNNKSNIQLNIDAEPGVYFININLNNENSKIYKLIKI